MNRFAGEMYPSNQFPGRTAGRFIVIYTGLILCGGTSSSLSEIGGGARVSAANGIQ